MKNPNILPTTISFFLISMGALITVLSASWVMSHPANYGVSNTPYVVGCVLGPIVMIIGIGMLFYLRRNRKLLMS